MSELGDDDPQRWRALEAEARAKAGKMTDPIAIEMMLEVADHYMKLAEHAERRRARDAT